MTGTTDFGHISTSDDPSCKLAYNIFVDRLQGYIGSYYVALGGQIDALVFAGGIGEKAVELRKTVTDGCNCLGFEIDTEKNGEKITDVVQDIGSAKSRHRVLVCQTDEQVSKPHP